MDAAVDATPSRDASRHKKSNARRTPGVKPPRIRRAWRRRQRPGRVALVGHVPDAVQQRGGRRLGRRVLALHLDEELAHFISEVRRHAVADGGAHHGEEFVLDIDVLDNGLDDVYNRVPRRWT